VHALARRLATFFADPVEVSLNVIMATGADAEYDRVVLAHYEPIFAAWRAVVTRAQDRDELDAGVDPDTVVMAGLTSSEEAPEDGGGVCCGV